MLGVFSNANAIPLYEPQLQASAVLYREHEHGLLSFAFVSVFVRNRSYGIYSQVNFLADKSYFYMKRFAPRKRETETQGYFEIAYFYLLS